VYLNEIYFVFKTSHGIGGIFSALFRALKPLASKGASLAVRAGKSALANSEVQSAIKDIQSAAINTGVKAINKALNPQKAAAAAATAPPPKKKVVKKKPKKVKAKKKKVKQGRGIF